MFRSKFLNRLFLSCFSQILLDFQEKLLLVPYASKRDVAYIVVAPENDNILANCKLFFRELSSVFEVSEYRNSNGVFLHLVQYQKQCLHWCI